MLYKEVKIICKAIFLLLTTVITYDIKMIMLILIEMSGSFPFFLTPFCNKGLAFNFKGNK